MCIRVCHLCGGGYNKRFPSFSCDLLKMQKLRGEGGEESKKPDSGQTKLYRGVRGKPEEADKCVIVCIYTDSISLWYTPLR